MISSRLLPADAKVPVEVPKSLRASVYVNGVLQSDPYVGNGDQVVVKSSDPSFQAIFYIALGRNRFIAVFDQEPDRIYIPDVYGCAEGVESATVAVTPTGYIQTEVVYYGDVLVDGVRQAAPLTLTQGQSISFLFEHDGETEDHSATFGTQVVMFTSYKKPAPKLDSALRNRAYAHLHRTYISDPIRNSSGYEVDIEVVGGRMVGTSPVPDGGTFQIAVDTGSTPAHIDADVRLNGHPTLRWSIWTDALYLDPVNVRVEPVGLLANTALPFASIPDNFYFDFTLPEGILATVDGKLYTGDLDYRGESASRWPILDATNATSLSVSFYPQLAPKMIEFGDATAYLHVIPTDSVLVDNLPGLDVAESDLPVGQAQSVQEAATFEVPIDVYAIPNVQSCSTPTVHTVLAGTADCPIGGFDAVVQPAHSNEVPSVLYVETQKFSSGVTKPVYIENEKIDNTAPGVSLVEFGTMVSTASVVRLLESNAPNTKVPFRRLLETNAPTMCYSLGPLYRPSVTSIGLDHSPALVEAGTLSTFNPDWRRLIPEYAATKAPDYRLSEDPSPLQVEPKYLVISSMFAAYEHESFSDYQFVHGMYSRRLFSNHRQTDTAASVELFTLQFEVRGIYDVEPRNFHLQERYPDQHVPNYSDASMRYPDQGVFHAEYIQRQYAFSAPARAQLVLPYIQSQQLMASEYRLPSSLFQAKAGAVYSGQTRSYGRSLVATHVELSVNTLETPTALPYTDVPTDYTFDGVRTDTSYTVFVGVEDRLDNGFFATELDALQNAVNVWSMDPSMVYAVQQPSGLWAWSQATAFNNLCSPVPKGYVSGG
jgi:hypothetical protein